MLFSSLEVLYAAHNKANQFNFYNQMPNNMPTPKKKRAYPLLESIKAKQVESSTSAKPVKRRACADDSDRTDKSPMPQLNNGRTKMGYEYMISTEHEWYYYHGFGWVHEIELPRFHDKYRKCAFSFKWFESCYMYTSDEGYLVSQEWVSDNGWKRCAYSERMYDPKLGFSVWKGSRQIMVSPYAYNCSTKKCDLSQKNYIGTTMVKVKVAPGKESNGIKQVAEINLTTEKMDHCLVCGAWFDRLNVLVPSEGLIEHAKMCPSCKSAALQKDVILAHDSNKYPPMMVVNRTNYRFNRETNKNELKHFHNPRLFGVECELEIVDPDRYDKRATYAMEVKKALGTDFCVIKHDGSLGGNKPDGRGGQYGFEIVTAPADFEIHKKRWMALKEATCYQRLRSWDADFCGMHVHVSREAITTLQLGRLLVFINGEKNKKFVQKVAGRSELKYCKYVDKHYGNALDAAKGRGSDEERRQAINQQNPKTIEFRIFRGTINPKHIIRNMEFCDAILDFCHPGSRSFKDLMTPDEFVKFCGDNRKKWPLFCEWLAFQGMIKLKKFDIKKIAKDKLTINPVGIEEHDQPKVGELAMQ